MRILILLIGLAVVTTLSIANDHHIKKKGGDTEYILEELKEKLWKK